MAYQLVVTHPFGTYVRGDHITDPAEIAKWAATHPAHVVRKVIPDHVIEGPSEAEEKSPEPSPDPK